MWPTSNSTMNKAKLGLFCYDMKMKVSLERLHSMFVCFSGESHQPLGLVHAWGKGWSTIIKKVQRITIQAAYGFSGSFTVMAFQKGLSWVVQSQVDSHKYRWDCTQGTLRTHLRSNHSDGFRKWSEPHVVTYNTSCTTVNATKNVGLICPLRFLVSFLLLLSLSG